MKSFAVPWSFAKRSVAMAPRRPLQCAALQRQPRPARRSWASAVCIRAPADDSLRPMFLTSAEAALVRERFGTPCYVYDRAALEAAARAALAFPQAFGLTLRDALKANPTPGGPASSFGIWHAYLDEAKALAARHRLAIRGLHTHIGSGSDPAVWTRVAGLVLEIAARLPDVTTVSLGGGFKVARVPGEQATDLVAVGSVVREAFVDFHRRTGRKLRLEIEPGAYLVANAGAVVATCVDVVDTGEDGYLFAKLDAGMTEVTRPSLYGAQHPITVVAGGRATARVVFVGPCCESGDVLTPAPGDPEALTPREVPRPEIG